MNRLFSGAILLSLGIIALVLSHDFTGSPIISNDSVQDVELYECASCQKKK